MVPINELSKLVKDSPDKPYFAYYLISLVKNLFVFISVAEDD